MNKEGDRCEGVASFGGIENAGKVIRDSVAGFKTDAQIAQEIQWTPYKEVSDAKIVNIVSLSVAPNEKAEDDHSQGPSQATIDINSEYSFVPKAEYDDLLTFLKQRDQKNPC